MSYPPNWLQKHVSSKRTSIHINVCMYKYVYNLVHRNILSSYYTAMTDITTHACIGTCTLAPSLNQYLQIL